MNKIIRVRQVRTCCMILGCTCFYTSLIFLASGISFFGFGSLSFFLFALALLVFDLYFLSLLTKADFVYEMIIGVIVEGWRSRTDIRGHYVLRSYPKDIIIKILEELNIEGWLDKRSVNYEVYFYPTDKFKSHFFRN